MMAKMTYSWACGFGMLLALVTATPSVADLDDTDRSLYAAADSLQRGLTLLGQPADSFSLAQTLREVSATISNSAITPESTVTEKDGNSAGQLDAAMVTLATQSGVAARVMGRLTPQDLRQLPGPAILRVRVAEDSDAAEHYILLEQVDRDQAIISASRLTGQPVPLLDLAALWSGDAIVLASSDAELDRFAPGAVSGARWPIGIALVIGLALFAAGLRLNLAAAKATPLNRRWRRLRRVAVQAVVLIAVVGIGASVYAIGFAQDRVGAVRAQAEHIPHTFIDFRDEQAPVIDHTSHDLTKDELAAFLAKDQIQWVDARTRKEFDKDHLPGAILLDRFDASTVRLRLAGIPRDTTLVVYCVNIDCGRGRAASAALAKAGFTQVSHYPPGWAELKGWDVWQHRELSRD